MRAILIFFSFYAFASVHVESSVSTKLVHPDDSITLTLNVRYGSSAEIGSIHLPDLKSFQVIGEHESSSFQMQNTRVSREKNYHYILQAKKLGKLRIGAIEVLVNGKAYKTDPIFVEVSDKAPRASKKPPTQSPFGLPKNWFHQPFGSIFDPDIAKVKDENIIFRLELAKSKFYLGELIYANWVLYLHESLTGKLFNLNLTQPRLDGFWVEQAKDPSIKITPIAKQTLNGQKYDKYLVTSNPLVPLRIGTLRIPAAKLTAELASRHIFHMGLPTVQKSSQDTRIKVIALPPNKDPFFTEAVGDFLITASLSKKNVRVNDSIAYTILFKGKGHPRFIRLPKLNFGPKIELYDQAESQKFSAKTSVKKYEMIIIPRKPGRLRVPSFELSTFDPDLSIYKTHILPAFSVQVESRGRGRAGQEVQNRYFKSSATSKKEDKILPFLLPRSQDEGKTKDKWESKIGYFWLLIYSALFILLLHGIWRSFFHRKKESLDAILHTYQKQVDQCIQKKDWKMAGVVLLDLFYLFLSELVKKKKALRNLEVLLEQLSPRLRQDYGKSIREQVDYLERLGFAPLHIASPLRNKDNVVKLKNQTFTLLKKLRSA